ncbi:MAG TPA: hypothetical protein VF353_01660 [Candidatus Binatia bacterium]
MTLLRNLLKPSLLSSLLLLAVCAEGAESGSKPVQIKIGTILASNESDQFDARLKPMERQLKVMKYRSYRLLKEDSQSVPWNDNATFEIPGGRSLAVSPQDSKDKQIALKVRLTEGTKPLLDTTVRLQGRGYFLLGGPPHEGGALVISISASAQ